MQYNKTLNSNIAPSLTHSKQKKTTGMDSTKS